MQNLADPSTGGFFSIVKSGQGKRAENIYEAVSARFSRMHLATWRVPCLAPSVDQKVTLHFPRSTPAILGDSRYEDVSLGIDPTEWPVDVNREYTRRVAESQSPAPGSELTILGEFCWGEDASRAEVYFLPSTSEVASALAPGALGTRQRTEQLLRLGVRGQTLRASDGYLRVRVPDQAALLHNVDGFARLRALIVDNRLMRNSGVMPGQVLSLPAVVPKRLRGNASTGCLSDADCRLVFLHDCSQVRSCQASCPGVGTPRSLPVWQPAPREPRCGSQPPCTPQCPTRSAPGFGPRAVCSKRTCVVTGKVAPSTEF